MGCYSSHPQYGQAKGQEICLSYFRATADLCVQYVDQCDNSDTSGYEDPFLAQANFKDIQQHIRDTNTDLSIHVMTCKAAVPRLRTGACLGKVTWC